MGVVMGYGESLQGSCLDGFDSRHLHHDKNWKVNQIGDWNARELFK